MMTPAGARRLQLSREPGRDGSDFTARFKLPLRARSYCSCSGLSQAGDDDVIRVIGHSCRVVEEAVSSTTTVLRMKCERAIILTSGRRRNSIWDLLSLAANSQRPSFKFVIYVLYDRSRIFRVRQRCFGRFEGEGPSGRTRARCTSNRDTSYLSIMNTYRLALNALSGSSAVWVITESRL